MPFITKDLKKYKGCKGTGVFCSKDILNKISNFKTVFDPFQQKNKSCYQSCEDQHQQVQTTTLNYPAEPIFSKLKDYCLLMLKFVDQCRAPVKKVSLFHCCQRLVIYFL